MGVIEGTTLEIIEDNNKGKVLCKCSVCGMHEIYDKKYLIENKQECKVCKQIKHLSEDDSINETNQIKILLAEEELIRKGSVCKMKAGRKYVNTSDKYATKYGNVGDNIVVIGVYGTWGKEGMLEPTHIVTRCLRCGALKIREIKNTHNVKVSYGCKTCEKIKEFKNAQTDKIKKLKENEELKKQEQIKNKLNQNTKKDQPKEKINIQRKVTAEDKEIEEYTETCRSNNPDSYVRVENVDGRKVVTYTCKKCGFIVKKVRPNKNYKTTECEGCTKRLKDKDYRGICKLNLRGRIYSGMEITNQYTDTVKGYLCDIKCAMCGYQDNSYIGVYLIDVMNRKYAHDCERSQVYCKCESCGKHTDIKVADIVRKEDVKCPNCNKVMDKTDLNYEVNSQDMKVAFNKARILADGTTKISKMQPSSNNKLFYDAVPIYRSNSEDYYRCICINHGSRLTLSETDINNYDCEKCNDVHEGIFKTLKSSNIRIKGNSKIKTEE